MKNLSAVKVCILTPVHTSFDSRIFYREAVSLAEAGYDVTLIGQHDRNETVDGVKIIALPKPRNLFQRILVLTFQILSFELGFNSTADIYHFDDLDHRLSSTPKKNWGPVPGCV